MESNMVKTAL